MHVCKGNRIQHQHIRITSRNKEESLTEHGFHVANIMKGSCYVAMKWIYVFICMALIRLLYTMRNEKILM